MFYYMYVLGKQSVDVVLKHSPVACCFLLQYHAVQQYSQVNQPPGDRRCTVLWLIAVNKCLPGAKEKGQTGGLWQC
jgi:hypothetical protein